MVREALQAGSIAAVVVLLPVTYALLRTPADESARGTSNPVANGHGGTYVGGPEALQGVLSTVLSAGHRATVSARNDTVWLAITALTVLLVLAINLIALGFVSVSLGGGTAAIALVFLLSTLLMMIGVYSVTSAWTEGNAMSILMTAFAIGLVALVAISGHVVFFAGFESG
jgi:magnesium-transporting ATPase (P-type)